MIAGKIRIIFWCLMLFTLCASGQPSKEYFEKARAARQYFNIGQYDSAASYYTWAFQSSRGAMRADRYNAAQVYAITGHPDSAFVQLEALTRADWSLYDSLIADKFLTSLHTDNRWKIVSEKIRVNAGLDKTSMNTYAAQILDTVLKDDQEGRNKLAQTQKTFGRDSKEYKALTSDIMYRDSINVRKVTRIIDSFGWLGKPEVGAHGNIAEFLVMQHASPQVQKKYLPVMRQAVKDGKLNSSYYAMFEDRILLSEGKDQIYGTQVAEAKDGTYFVEPLDDPDNVDARRKSVGLSPMETYLKDWKITWDVIAYKKNIEHYRQLERSLNSPK